MVVPVLDISPHEQNAAIHSRRPDADPDMLTRMQANA
jgi:hypothetical protein